MTDGDLGYGDPRGVVELRTALAGYLGRVRGVVADPERVVVAGGSAGGYLTLLTGCRVRPRPTALVAYWGYGDVDGDWYTKPSDHYRTNVPLVGKDEAYQAVGGPVLTGTVTQFHGDKGFGFIVPDDVFVHISAVRGGRGDEPEEGDRVRVPDKDAPKTPGTDDPENRPPERETNGEDSD